MNLYMKLASTAERSRLGVLKPVNEITPLTWLL